MRKNKTRKVDNTKPVVRMRVSVDGAHRTQIFVRAKSGRVTWFAGDDKAEFSADRARASIFSSITLAKRMQQTLLDRKKYADVSIVPADGEPT